MKKTIIFALLALTLAAEDKKPATLTEKQVASYFKIQTAIAQQRALIAENELVQANNRKNLDAMVRSDEEIQVKACGAKYAVGKDGEPTCESKPKPEAAK